MTQRDKNPFSFSDTNKRYHTAAYHLRRTFGGKIARIPLDGGFSCPNKDGTCGFGGCVFCAGGSASLTARGEIEEQYRRGRDAADAKWQASGYIPYLQANTNTYGDVDDLRNLYLRCARLPGAVMLAIGTRADCLSDGVLEVLSEVSKEIPLLIELGMQTMHDDTLAAIRRGYGHEAFLAGYARLDAIRKSSGVRIGLHILNGLPGEDASMMLATAKEAARLLPDEVKIHTLCVLRGTVMEEIHRRGAYDPMEMGDAVALTAHQLTYLPPQVVIGRIGADAPRDQLIAPMWVRNKMAYENALDRYLYENDLWQGKEWK